jgi:hypothetical protein
MASYLKRYLDNPGKSIDLLETVVQKLSDKIDLSGYEADELRRIKIRFSPWDLGVKGPINEI